MRHLLQNRTGPTPNAARRGAVTVEFAMVIPIFFLLTFASIEIARINMLRHAVENATYEAARAGIVPGATEGEVIAAATKHLQGCSGANGLEVTVSPSPLTEDATELTVTSSLPLDQNAWVAPRFAAGLTLTRSVTLKTERFFGMAPPSTPRAPAPRDATSSGPSQPSSPSSPSDPWQQSGTWDPLGGNSGFPSSPSF